MEDSALLLLHLLKPKRPPPNLSIGELLIQHSLLLTFKVTTFFLILNRKCMIVVINLMNFCYQFFFLNYIVLQKKARIEP
jgi:hypothetical protein